MLHKLSFRQKILYYGALLLLALVILFPIYYMLSISLKLPRDIYRSPSLLPLNATGSQARSRGRHFRRTRRSDK